MPDRMMRAQRQSLKPTLQLVAGYFKCRIWLEGLYAVALVLDMAQSQPRQGIPTKLSKAQFEQFILPHLSKGRRGPATTLSFYAIFNYILCVLYLGCQWKHLPIEKDRHGRREIHPTSLYRTFRPWQAGGCLCGIFER